MPGAAGLPELTAYFLLNEGLEPETLYSHCRPRSREGLITQPAGTDNSAISRPSFAIDLLRACSPVSCSCICMRLC